MAGRALYEDRVVSAPAWTQQYAACFQKAKRRCEGDSDRIRMTREQHGTSVSNLQHPLCTEPRAASYSLSLSAAGLRW